MSRNHVRKAKPIQQLSLDDVVIKEFKSINAASTELNIDSSAISKCCRGIAKTVRGFKWEYTNEPTNPVNSLDKLYEQLKDAVEHYCKLKEGYADVIVLWIMGTYFISKINTFPRLVITSPQRGCGKSQVLKVINALTVNSLVTADTTSAVLFRLDKTSEPIRLIDEAEHLLGGNNNFTSILNSGFERGICTERCDDITSKPEGFDVYMPIVLAGIQLVSKMEDTTLSRSIVLNVQKESGCPVAELKPLEVKYEALRAKATSVIDSYKSKYKRGSPPSLGDSRTQDCWSALFGITRMLSKDKQELLLSVYKQFSSDYEDTDEGKIILNILKRLVDHPSVKKKKVDGENEVYIQTKSLFDLLQVDGELLDYDISLTQRKFTTIITAYEVQKKKLKFGDSRSGVSAISEKDLQEIFTKYVD